MGQPIRMEWIPKKDIENLQNLLSKMEQYGFIHEDLTNEIFTGMAMWAIQQPEFNKKFIEDAKKEGYDVDDADSFLEYISDYDDGEMFWSYMLDEIPEEFAKYTALMFRGFIYESAFGCSGSYVSDFDEYIQNVEEVVKEQFEYFKSENFFQ